MNNKKISLNTLIIRKKFSKNYNFRSNFRRSFKFLTEISYFKADFDLDFGQKMPISSKIENFNIRILSHSRMQGYWSVCLLPIIIDSLILVITDLLFRLERIE